MHFVAPGDSNTVKHIVSESVSATLLHLGATWLYSVLEVTTLHLGATWLHSVLGFPPFTSWDNLAAQCASSLKEI